MFLIALFLGIIALCEGIQVTPVPGSTVSPRYHNYREMTQVLNELARNYSNFATLYTVGQTVEQREMWVLRIRAPNSPVLGVPHVKLVGNIHGNEPIGKELILYLAEYLLKNYHHNEEVKWLLDRTIIHLMPSMNPDGFERSIEGKCMVGPGRTNTNNVDLNRSFPDHFKENPIPPQPETVAMARWLSQVPFVLSVSFHGGAMVANYPYDSYPVDEQNFFGRPESRTPDDDVFKHLARTYANNHLTMHTGNACGNGQPPFPGGITNGAAWYDFYGGMQDFNYVAHGCMELTLEVSCCKYPKADQLPRFWNENKKAMLEFIKQAQTGVRGLVLDKVTSAYIPDAVLYVSGRHVPFTTSKNGEFWRVLLPGQYILTVAAKGYYSQSFPFTVHPTNGTYPTSTWLNIYLQPLDQLVPESSSNNFQVTSSATSSRLPSSHHVCLLSLVFVVIRRIQTVVT